METRRLCGRRPAHKTGETRNKPTFKNARPITTGEKTRNHGNLSSRQEHLRPLEVQRRLRVLSRRSVVLQPKGKKWRWLQYNLQRPPKQLRNRLNTFPAFFSFSLSLFSLHFLSSTPSTLSNPSFIRISLHFSLANVHLCFLPASPLTSFILFHLFIDDFRIELLSLLFNGN